MESQHPIVHESSTHNRLPLIIASILICSITGLAVFLGTQNKNYSPNQPEQINVDRTSKIPAQIPEPSPSQTTRSFSSLYVLEKDPLVVSYAHDGDPASTLNIAYNQTLISIPSVPIIVEAYPSFADATYLYHGDVIGKEMKFNSTIEQFGKWHVVSAVRKTTSARLKEEELPRSEYEKNLSGYTGMLSGLLSEDLQKFILLDYRNAGKSPLPSINPNITSLRLHDIYPYFNYYGDATTNRWNTSYLNLRRGPGQTGGGYVDVQSDSKSHYFIDYLPVPFETMYEQQPEADSMYGTPIYQALDQKNTLKSYDGHQYTKYIMRAENGFTYILYK